MDATKAARNPPTMRLAKAMGIELLESIPTIKKRPRVVAIHATPRPMSRRRVVGLIVARRIRSIRMRASDVATTRGPPRSPTTLSSVPIVTAAG